jgi:hexosaminidase
MCYVSVCPSIWYIGQVKGSETLPWGEMIDETNIDQKLWPRSAALAEALWRGPDATRAAGGWYGADPRMQQWRNTLVKRGVSAEALQPQWCQQREAYACTLPVGRPQ